ncbi:MAG: ribbon-helix-helix protein, CopG family [Leptolyngbyaceae cyanobacterium]
MNNRHGGKRGGAGRPAKENAKVLKAFRLSANLVAKLKALAEEKGQSQTEIVESLLLKAITNLNF